MLYHTNRCKNFPWSLEDLEDYEVFYHGTGHKAAKDIVTGAIELARGKLQRDFSSGNGCCLGKNFDETLDTKFASDKPPTSVVLVFLTKKDNLRGPKLKMKGLTLKPAKKWKEVFRLFRMHWTRSVENLQRSIEIMKTPEKPKESTILLKDRWLATKEISHTLKRLTGRISVCKKRQMCWIVWSKSSLMSSLLKK